MGILFIFLSLRQIMKIKQKYKKKNKKNHSIYLDFCLFFAFISSVCPSVESFRSPLQGSGLRFLGDSDCLFPFPFKSFFKLFPSFLLVPWGGASVLFYYYQILLNYTHNFFFSLKLTKFTKKNLKNLPLTPPPPSKNLIFFGLL